MFAYDLLERTFQRQGCPELDRSPRPHLRRHPVGGRQDHHRDGGWLQTRRPDLQGKRVLPRPQGAGLANLVYSIHFYSGWDPEFTKGDNSFDHGKVLQELVRVGKLEQKRWKVPIYIGEFSTMHDLPNDLAGMKMIMTEFNGCGWHYSPWTWKYVNDDEEGSIWGVYQYNQPWEQTPNMYRDSKDSILNTIAKLTTRQLLAA